MKYKIGIFGSALGETEEMKKKARELGEVLSKTDSILITGACTGLPYDVVSTAHFLSNATEIWGYSPAYDFEEQKSLSQGTDNSIYTKLFYTPREFPVADVSARRKYRNVLSTFASDAGIIVSGRWGTMNEFTNLFDMGKIIGVLVGTGGAADNLADWNERIKKKSNAVLLYESDPKKLVELIFKEIANRT